MSGHLLLIGFMGAGKTTVATLVGKRLAMPVLDLDHLIESEQSRTIAEIFDAEGEEAFRALEADALAPLAGREPSVVACGGGVVLSDENRALLSGLGFVAYLAVSAEETLARVGADPSRPLLRRGALDAGRLLASRDSLYAAAADVRIDTVGLSPQEVSEQVVAAYENHLGPGSSDTPARVHVSLPSDGYDVLIGSGLLKTAGPQLRAVCSARKAALISDETVHGLLGERVERSMAEAGFEVVSLQFAGGETSKSWHVAGELLEQLAAHNLDRGDLVVALGGGVTGDLAGFVASTYLRGVAFAQIPTTLLAQVDSSVGGKTGVDLSAGKNLAGAFKQPVLVLADTSVLASLPDTEWASGLAEVAKSALIDSEEFTSWLELNADALVRREEPVVAEAVRRCVSFKARVVSADEKESGQRECLNYGHTLAHALETVLGYGAVSHGMAVAEGMRFAARLGADIESTPAAFTRRQDALLSRLVPPFPPSVYDIKQVLSVMRSDKKAREGRVRFVLLRAPGLWRCEPVDDGSILKHLQEWRESIGADEGSAPGDR